uniref:Protein Notchless n=1 Tax=Cacopsylla melanoneura TaxID=428564 RepID=A0A8D8W7I0_9HEMI
MEVDSDDTITTKRILTRFKSDNGEVAGDLLDLPLNVNTEHLSLIVNSLLQQEEGTPYLFFVNEQEITKSLADALNLDTINTEEVVDIVYQRQALFQVRPVTRCTSSMPGHAEAVISVKFSPDGRSLASGSGDTTVRFWDVDTQTPQFKCEGHKHWVLCIDILYDFILQVINIGFCALHGLLTANTLYQDVRMDSFMHGMQPLGNK